MNDELLTSDLSDSWSYEPENHRILRSPQPLIVVGMWLAVGLIGLASLWQGLVYHQNLISLWFGNGISWRDLVMGLMMGGLASLSLWVLGEHFEVFVAIRHRLVMTIDFSQISLGQIILISLLAAIPEEVFFRGALQPTVGLIIASLIFGALHSITWVYFLYATLAGLALGVMVEWRGDLWLAIGTHFAVDFISLLLLRAWVRRNATLSDGLN